MDIVYLWVYLNAKTIPSATLISVLPLLFAIFLNSSTRNRLLEAIFVKLELTAVLTHISKIILNCVHVSLGITY